MAEVKHLDECAARFNAALKEAGLTPDARDRSAALDLARALEKARAVVRRFVESADDPR